jgi:hypothetical protein
MKVETLVLRFIVETCFRNVREGKRKVTMLCVIGHCPELEFFDQTRLVAVLKRQPARFCNHFLDRAGRQLYTCCLVRIDGCWNERRVSTNQTRFTQDSPGLEWLPAWI